MRNRGEKAARFSAPVPARRCPFRSWIKDPAHTGPCKLHYYDIGGYLSREEKLDRIEAFGSADGIDWQTITPNAAGDWINQRDPVFDTFIPLGDKGKGSQAVFAIYSLGVVTARDAWAYNMSRTALAENMRRMIDAFNQNSRRYAILCAGKNKASCPKIEDVIDADPRQISWTRALKADAKRGKRFVFDETALTTSMYRPYTKQWLYFNRRFNEMVCQQPKLFPTPKKILPRIPYARDFFAFCKAGRELGNWHLNYETVEPYPLAEGNKRLIMEGNECRVAKMRFGKKDRMTDKTVIAYNQHLVLRDIPLGAYDYIVNGKPAIEWIMERYQVTTEKRSGIENDPNAWSEDPRYIVDLVKRIVTVSVESVRIINSLPPLNAAVA